MQKTEDCTEFFHPLTINNSLSIDKIYSIHYFAYTKEFNFMGERHNFWELVYCDAGSAQIMDDNKEFLLEQGCAFLHAPGTFHNIRTHNCYTNTTIIGFDGNLDQLKHIQGTILTLSANEKSLLKSILYEAKQSFFLPLNIVDQRELLLNDKPQFATLQIIKNSLENLMIFLFRKNEQNYFEKEDKSSLNYICNQIIEILKANLNQNFNLSDIAYRIGYSVSYLKVVFKKYMNTTIIKYYTVLKIERAKQLLSEKKYNISQISEQLGYESVQYFCKQFRDYVKISPKDYEKTVGNGIL